MRKELPFSFDCGDLGLRDGVVLADIDGTRVPLVAATIGFDGIADLLPMLTLSAREKLIERFKDLTGARDAIFDWDPREGTV